MSLTDRDTHFEFGENWRDYAKTIDQRRIGAAVEGVRKLFPEGLAGKSFLDIGCGSGLHSLAALILGASPVTALDIDENSVASARETLTTHGSGQWSARVASVFDLSPEITGTFDVVYSWGVLHHTGDMWRAIETAAHLVKPGGLFCIAIYYATLADGFWKTEKRFYSQASKPVQWAARQLYMAALLAGYTLKGRNPVTHVRTYSRIRGMNFSHDAHDWLGGYPYETASGEQMRDFLSKLGFVEARSFVKQKALGLLGSGCNEFVFRRPIDKTHQR